MKKHNTDDQLLLLNIELSFPVAPGSNGENEEEEAWRNLLDFLKGCIWVQDTTETNTFTHYCVRRSRLQPTLFMSSQRLAATKNLDFSRIKKDMEVYVSVVCPQLTINLSHSYLSKQ